MKEEGEMEDEGRGRVDRGKVKGEHRGKRMGGVRGEGKGASG